MRNTMNHTLVRRTPLQLTLLAAACVVATASFAQTPPPASPPVPPAADNAPQTPQKVEITGSRIKRVDAEGASPVEVIRREDIRRTGATSVREALETLTVTSTNGATITDVNGSNTFAPGASQPSLRNLGAQSTLLLLNGRRIAIYPLPNFQETFSNLDSIPLEAVERIEVLKVGGSAVYGSDAIAGVINVITRDSYQGVQVDGSAQHSTKTGRFGEKSGSITAGIGDFSRDGYNILGNVELFHRDEVMWNTVLDAVNPRYYQNDPAFGSPSSYGYPGNIIGQGAVDTGVACPPDLQRGPYCYYDRYTRFEAVPEARRVNGILTGKVRLNDQTSLYGELDMSKIDTTYQSAYATYGSNNAPITWLNPNTGLNNSFYYQPLPPTNPLNQTGDYAELRYRFTDSGADQTANTNQFRALGGVKGSLGSWDYDTAVGALGAKSVDRSRGQFSNSGFIQEIGDYNNPDDNFFNQPNGYRIGQVNSPEVLNTLFPKYGWDAKTSQEFWDGNLRTDNIGTLPGGNIGVSVGFDVRHEKMVLTPTANLAANDIVGFAFSESNASRNYGAVYGELSLPLTKTFEADFAGRLDKFPGFGAHFSPRANFRFQPTKDLLFRATVETGFRAPNLQESSPSTKTAFQGGISDPKRCPAATAVANDYRAYADENFPVGSNDWNLYYAIADQVFTQECSNSLPIVAVNNPALKPETSRSVSFGSVLQVTKTWNAAIDYFHIERKNEIGLKPIADLLASESSQPPGTITRLPFDPTGNTDPTFTGDQLAEYNVTSGALSSVRLQYGNSAKTRTSGVDFDVRGEIPTPVGVFATHAYATYTANYQIYSDARGGTGGWGDNLSRLYGYPQWSINFANQLTTGDFTNGLRWIHQSGQKLRGDYNELDGSGGFTYDPDGSGCAGVGVDPSDCKLRDYNRWDYDLSWNGIKGLTLGMHVFNLLQQRPPVDQRAFGGNSGIIPVSNEDAAGRTIKFYLSYKFL